MNGIEAVKRIRQMGYKRPIVALTANALAGQADMFKTNGFDEFISKPIDTRVLNAVLNDLIRDKQPPEVIKAARQVKAKEVKPNAQRIRMVEAFMKDAEKAEKALRDYKDLDLYTTTVHGIKSALYNVGENDLSDFAKRLEDAGKQRDIEIIQSETPKFLSALGTILSKYEYKNHMKEAPLTDADKKYLYSRLAAIQSACGAFDKNTAKVILNQVLERDWPGDIKDLLNSIARHLLHSLFIEIDTEINNFMAKS